METKLQQYIIDKYNVPVPRYTSYPPANYFSTDFTEEQYRQEILRSNTQTPAALSFYFHIPFCRRLCHYCGCNAYPMAAPEKISRYVEALHREIDLVIPMLDKTRKISQIHYGGGTPTVLPVEALKELNAHLLEHFAVAEQPEIAIECHPGWLDESYWTNLAEDCGFTRFSIGVQDVREDVLKCINRKKPQMPVDEIVRLLHERGARVNMDFLYGLPLQTPESFGQSIRYAISCQPDRLVTFSYAHVPWVNKRQLILEEAGLPDAPTKNRMFETAQKELTENGYIQIGMDHFVRPDDELALALQNNALHRNFQGYCTRRTTGQVYAFGVTGISQLATAYAQNTKDIDQYIASVEAGVLPVVKGYVLNEKEQITRHVIDMLMCNNVIHWDRIADDCNQSIEAVKQAVEYNDSRIAELVRDGIVTLDTPECLRMTPEGKIFVRNVASVFDSLTRTQPKSFSKPI